MFTFAQNIRTLVEYNNHDANPEHYIRYAIVKQTALCYSK